MTNEYYITFGQSHPAQNGFVVVEADSWEKVHEWALKEYNRNFCIVYSKEDFEAEFFPLGELQRIKLIEGGDEK